MTEYLIFGLSRSGLHPVASWIMTMCHGPAIYLNHVDLNGKPAFSPEYHNGATKDKADFVFNVMENKTPIEVARYIKKNPKLVPILVMRDPYNLFASRLVLGRRRDLGGWMTGKHVRLWKKYARQSLRENWPRNVLLIKYNEWAVRADKRILIAERLGLKTDGAPLLAVPKHGGGSSFDLHEFKGKGDKMQVNARWKQLRRDVYYLKLFDQEVESLAKDLFALAAPIRIGR